jgi:hypothetical protein
MLGEESCLASDELKSKLRMAPKAGTKAETKSFTNGLGLRASYSASVKNRMSEKCKRIRRKLLVIHVLP